jgi:excinuclease ABC subunit A
MLSEIVPKGQFLWNNQNVVYLMVPGVRKPWATVYTKKLAGVDLILNGPKGAFQLGSVADLGTARALDTDAEDKDQVKLRFVTSDELHAENVAAFLRVHVESLTTKHPLAV